jgi:alpha,alpha-trehalase
LPSALAALEALVAPGTGVALFLDYDGTLTPIVERPELAVLSEDARSAVREVAARCPVIVVSGRDRADVEKLVAIEGLGYVGSHGFDIVGPRGSGIRREIGSEALPALAAAESELGAAARSIPGCVIERKRLGVAVHYRLVVDEHLSAVHTAVRTTLEHHPELREASGKKVLELRPAIDWSKGSAVLWLLDELRLGHALAMHLGDDRTDETVFAALKDRGVGIFVGREDQPTDARYRLDDPEEVRTFLLRLARMLDARRP